MHMVQLPGRTSANFAGDRCCDSQESLATDIIDAVMDALLKPLLKRMKDRRGAPWRLHQKTPQEVAQQVRRTPKNHGLYHVFVV